MSAPDPVDVRLAELRDATAAVRPSANFTDRVMVAAQAIAPAPLRAIRAVRACLPGESSTAEGVASLLGRWVRSCIVQGRDGPWPAVTARRCAYRSLNGRTNPAPACFTPTGNRC